MKNRKNIFNLIIFILLFIATIYILIQNKNSTTKVKPTDFSISDTASIRKIFIADMKGQSVSLTKSNHHWLVNDEFPVNTSKMELLLDVLKRVEVKNPTPASMRENVIKDMAAGAVKVEIYKKGIKPFKIIYIGGPTQDMLGTFMALENKRKEPYVVHLPGFNGYLSEGYFFTDINEWRSKEVFNYQPGKIKSVRVIYNGNGDSSFTLNVSGTNNFNLIQSSTNEEIIPLDQQKVKSFLQAFTKLHFMSVETDIKGFKRDSIFNSEPVITISVTTIEDEIKSLKLFYRPSDIRTRLELFPGVDKEYFLATVSDRAGDLVVMQRLVLDRIMWKTGHFKIEK